MGRTATPDCFGIDRSAHLKRTRLRACCDDGEVGVGLPGRDVVVQRNLAPHVRVAAAKLIEKPGRRMTAQRGGEGLPSHHDLAVLITKRSPPAKLTKADLRPDGIESVQPVLTFDHTPPARSLAAG